MRKNLGEDKKLVAQFFNSIFLSIEEQTENNDMIFQIEDKTEKYNTLTKKANKLIAEAKMKSRFKTLANIKK